MDNVFTAGELIPYSGVYRITHYPPHVSVQAITLAKGNNFPRCVDCAHVSFMLVNELFNSTLFSDLLDRELFPETWSREVERGV